MTAYTLIWQPAAVAGLIRIRTTDPQTAKAVRTAVSALAEDAQPPGSTPLGGAGLRRLRLGDVRVLYEIDDTHQAIHVLTIGHRRLGSLALQPHPSDGRAARSSSVRTSRSASSASASTPPGASPQISRSAMQER